MALALQLAARGRGTTGPNPMVGAVIVARGRVVGQAFHRRPGELHAEALALRQAGSRARGGTLYLTLEPCCHTSKRTPPCLPLILAAQLARVVIAMPDPNPAVRGRSIRALRKAGLRVSVGRFAEDAALLNRIYCHWMRTGRPWVILKAAMTLDGKIATAAGESQWITGSEARADTHRVRSQVDAVMVGSGTALRDDPQLTARLVEDGSMGRRLAARQPVRVVADSALRVPATARVYRRIPRSRAIAATTRRGATSRARGLEQRGVEVIRVSGAGTLVPLRKLMMELGRRQVSSLLLEGGSTLNAAALRAGIVNQVRLYVAPQLLGGQDAKGVIGGRSPLRLAQMVPLSQLTLEQAGDDLIIDGTIPAR